ncbi:MAG: undecaprenyldiphospho-muramoylpentapeptide beta-N-acetylglucosaminyltransferase [Flavobacteriales bacterium]|nr:undecaprenyldiphospho-muramoylpentapeptide beta-N-acetylglucosaminyltransferase [Flavobacteriales bacterium]MBO73632.1 undecaprenyldiphospho-muramoylpentapeptide beta-N-acetylglucosaminyltransferase [Flavobacteriales bacterium]|tara:strand:- start:51382 stop:52491 length:1110 start_codon:yes stop_codon:yes gene_type:complete
MKKSPKVIISGGGTGGHIFPAVAIANAIKLKYPDANILFVGAKGKMEMEKVPKAGYPIEGLWISGIQRKLTISNLSFPFKLISSLWKSRNIIKRFNPDLCIGVGGFASGPLLKAATWAGIPTLIHESNSYPGITNKLLGKNVNTVCVAFQGMEKFFPKAKKLVITGNPVRQEILNLDGKKEKGLRDFGLEADKPVVLSIGGSQGARSINQALDDDLEKFVEKGYQLLWQTGKFYKTKSQDRVDKIGSNLIHPHEFIYTMDLAYSVADVVVSRSGAMSVTELSLVGKPCVLVPFPFAAEDHQTANAMALVNNNAGVLVKDSEVKNKLFQAVDSLLSDEEKRRTLKRNIEKLKIENAADLIMAEVNKLLEN